MKLSDLFGLRSRLRRLRIMTGEGALALEDRTHLLRFAWHDEKERIQLILGLVVVVVGLTTVAVALLSVALVVQFWDTPQRALVAWLVAGLWALLWLVAVVMLVQKLGMASKAFEPARETFERDLAWFHAHFGADDEEAVRRPPPPVSRDELMARIERQRMRIETLQAAADDVGAAPVANETVSAAAVRIAREHPVASGMASAALLAVLGPKRLVRWAAVVAPVLWRMR